MKLSTIIALLSFNGGCSASSYWLWSSSRSLDKDDIANDQDLTANRREFNRSDQDGYSESDADDFECGVYIAKSAIGGIGVFAGRNFSKYEKVRELGDIVIPIVERALQIPVNTDDRHFLFDAYVWDTDALRIGDGAIEVDLLSCGNGAISNCVMDFVNTKSLYPENVETGLHRTVDPGIGAFSAYRNHFFYADKDIFAGEELFESYGSGWFATREKKLGKLPIRGDHRKAQRLIDRVLEITKDYSRELRESLWEVITQNPYRNNSRDQLLLPRTWLTVEDWIENGGVEATKRATYSRDITWLKEHGVCADNLISGRSTIPQAGFGAFARRNFSKGTLVSTLPLAHITNKSDLDMHEVSTNATSGKRMIKDDAKVVGRQLLLNYCFGHEKSTLLLCPYSTEGVLVNHSPKGAANVELRWASPTRSAHNDSWLERSVDDLSKEKQPVVAMELVAARDITKGQELFLDYGQQWQRAWKYHRVNFNPEISGRALRYVSAAEFGHSTSIFKTEFEQMHRPYPPNIAVMCNDGFRETEKDKRNPWGNISFADSNGGTMSPCEVLSRELKDDGSFSYRVIYTKTGVVFDVPSDAIRFYERPLTSDDQNLPNAFRHEIMIPDELFPLAWRNL